MDNFYIYIFGLVCFIVAVSYYNTWYSNNIYKYNEEFVTGERRFLLMGDSVLHNNVYVQKGKSVLDLLNDKFKNNPVEKVVSLAKNDATIVSVYNQISAIPPLFKSGSSSVIFLSIGGNDILNQLAMKKEDVNLDAIFDEYKILVKTIQDMVPKAQLYIFDLYYPRNDDFEKYYTIIQEWNNKIFNLTMEKNLKLFKISNILTQPEDFTDGMEPSAIGGKKLVDEMLKIY